jgi:hypothetical protein
LTYIINHFPPSSVTTQVVIGFGVMEDGYNPEVEALRLAEYPHMNNGLL